MAVPLLPRRTGSVLGLLLLAGALLSTAALGHWLTASASASFTSADKTFRVVPRTIEVAVSGEGTVESADRKPVVCRVAKRTSIISIVPEGNHVSRGDVVAELDSTEFREELVRRKVQLLASQAAFELAKQDSALHEEQSQSEMAAAKLALKLARLDREKYAKGDFVAERNSILGETRWEQQRLAQAKERVAWSEKLARKGFVTQGELEADRIAAERAEHDLKVVRQQLKTLDRYTYPRQTAELQGAVLVAERELERIKHQSRAKRYQLQAALASARRVYRKRRARVDWLQAQIERCTVTAPTDGMVLYPKDRRGRPDREIREGAEVRQRQVLVLLTDLKQLEVKLWVHESQVALLEPEQPALIRVAGLRHRVFHGTVEMVGVLPSDDSSWDHSNEYLVRATVDDPATALVPGMTADVEITAVHLPGTLAVPASAVVSEGGKNYCLVETPEGTEQRPVVLGQSDDRFIQVKDGLNEGDGIVREALAAAHH